MDRYLFGAINNLALNRGKIAFISGPRQVGKTTLSKQLSKKFDQIQYLNWDESEFRRIWTKYPNKITEKFDLTLLDKSRLVILDEIHKSKGWKQKLKGLYDHFAEELKFIVTGSARLNIFKKGSDSLLGRYLNFRLHPLSYGELSNAGILDPEMWKKSIFTPTHETNSQTVVEKLFSLGGFPEPYFSNDEKILNIWRRTRTEKIIREDLRDLSHLPELSQIEMLVSLLPEKIGNPLSVQSLREDLEVSHDTVRRWLNYLTELYYFFEIRPWTKSVARTLKKEPKIYFYEWTEIESVGPSFENMLAVHLQKACHFWTDTGEGDFSLHYLRNKEKQEIDFLIVKNKKPWLAVEAKYSDKNIDTKAVDKFIEALQVPYVQVVFQDGVYRLEKNKLLVSANSFLKNLP